MLIAGNEDDIRDLAFRDAGQDLPKSKGKAVPAVGPECARRAPPLDRPGVPRQQDRRRGDDLWHVARLLLKPGAQAVALAVAHDLRSCEAARRSPGALGSRV